MSEIKKISVITTIYNGENYLRECLDSILGQSLKEIEIICIDDASKDTTSTILKEYEKKDLRIKIITNAKNYGAGASRNIGFKASKGKYVIFLDVDDYFEMDMLEQAFKRAEEYMADICIFKENSFRTSINGKRVFEDYPYSQVFLEKLGERKYFPPEEIKDVLFNLWNGWAWDKLFRRDFISEKKLEFQELETTNDGYFVHSALASAKRITYLNNIYVHHRINVKTSLSSRRDHSWNCCYLYLKKLKSFLINSDKFKIFEMSFVNWAANFLRWNFETLNEKSRKDFFAALKEYMLDEFCFLDYEQSIFYNVLDYWFIRRIYECKFYEECEVPIGAIEKWTELLKKDNKRIEKVFQHIKKYKYNVGIWGIGQQGNIFLEKYKDKVGIRKAYDQDLKKVGKKIKEGCVIELFNENTSDDIDFIIVMGRAYFKEVSEIVRKVKPEIKLFDLQSYLEPYLSFPLSLEDCII